MAGWVRSSFNPELRSLACTPAVDFNFVCGPRSGSKPSISTTMYSLRVRTSSFRPFKAAQDFAFERDCQLASGHLSRCPLVLIATQELWKLRDVFQCADPFITLKVIF